MRTRNIAPQPCIRCTRTSDATMMHACASAAKLRDGGPILRVGLKPWAGAGHHHLGS
jgi:hypothetical protein